MTTHPLTLVRLQRTITEHQTCPMDELHRRLVASFGPEADAVLAHVMSIVDRDIRAGRDPFGVLGGALVILLLTVSDGGAE